MNAGIPSLGSLDLLETVLRSDFFWFAADVTRTEKTTGRPSEYPYFMGLLYGVLVDIWRSARRVAVEIQHPVIWEQIRALVRERFPDDPSMWLPAKPMRRHQYLYRKRTSLALRDTLGSIRKVNTRLAINLTRTAGLMDPEGPGSMTHPDLSRIFYADGKVVASMFRSVRGETRVDKKTGKTYAPRFDPDATPIKEGGSDHPVRGLKFATLMVRAPEARIVLDVDYVAKGRGGEAAVTLDMLRGVAPGLPGGQAIAYDMGWRGPQCQAAMCELGLISITPVVSESNPKVKKGEERKREPRKTELETKLVRNNKGERRPVKVWAFDGAAGTFTRDVNGKPLFVPFERYRGHKNGRPGAWRLYQDYRIPDDLGGGDVTIRLHNDAADEKAEINRADSLRAIPPGDPDFERLYGRRADAESFNRGVENQLYINRAHSIGWEAQLFDMLCHVIVENARAEQALRPRERIRAA